MNSKTYRYFIALAAIVLFTGDSYAIPAFARKYDMSCVTCHAPVPKLKAYGEEFAGNGFQLPDKEPPRFYRDTGDDELLLMRELPLALRLEGYLRWQPQTAKRLDFQSPYLLKVLSGGIIAKDISYYFYFFLAERGDVAGIEDAFIMFNNVFGSDLDVYVGQFQVSDPLFKRELRLTLEDYQIYRTRPGVSRVNLTYDRGIMLTYGFPTGTDVTLEVLNGTGIGAADAMRNFDDDKYKNLFLRVSQEISEHLRVGGFGYHGREERYSEVNTMWMLGPDITLSTGQMELNVQYIEREDDNPWFTVGAGKTTTRGAFGELIFSPEGDRSRWYAAALYNWAEVKSSASVSYRTEKYHSATAHLSFLPARNIRLVGEYTYDFQLKANKLSAGFVSAF